MAASALGLVHPLTAAYLVPSAADAMVYVVIAIGLVFRPSEAAA